MTAIASGAHHTLALATRPRAALLSFGRPTYGALGRPGVDVERDEAVHDPQARVPLRRQLRACVRAWLLRVRTTYGCSALTPQPAAFSLLVNPLHSPCQASATTTRLWAWPPATPCPRR